MKKLILSALAVAALQYSSFAQTTSLFDGKTTAGWHAYLQKDAGPWSVVDGALQFDPKAPNSADLVTDGEYENYELSIDWKIAEGGNSGIIFGVHEDPTLGATYLSGIEMQVLDNEKAEDNKKANHLAGSLYDMKAAPADAAKPAGQAETSQACPFVDAPFAQQAEDRSPRSAGEDGRFAARRSPRQTRQAARLGQAESARQAARRRDQTESRSWAAKSASELGSATRSAGQHHHDQAARFESRSEAECAEAAGARSG